MTDVPPGQGRPEDDSESWEPTGARRSTFTPPPAETEPPAFDDDALADALAAQVAAYTSPVPIVRPPAAPESPESEARSTSAAPPAPEPGPASAVPAPESPAPEPTESERSVSESPASENPASDLAAPETAASSPVEPAVSPTLEAIERLESELRRRAEEARVGAAESAPVAVPPVEPEPEPASEAPGPLFPAPPTYLRPAPPEPRDDAEIEPEPGTGPGPIFPFSPPTGAIPVVPPPAPQPVAPPQPSWLTEPPASEPVPLPAPPGYDPSGADAPAPLPEPFAPRQFETPEPVDEPAEHVVEPVEPAAEPAEPAESVAGPVEPTGSEPAVASEPPPAFGPPPLVEPPVLAPPAGPPTTAAEPPAPSPAGSLTEPPTTPPVDLPPPSSGAVDFAHLPPPIGLEPAALPPYDPAAESPLPPPHPDDLGVTPVVAAPSPFAPPAPVPLVDDDAVDETDRAFGTGAIPVDSTGAATVVAPPSQPIPTVRLAEDEPGLVDREPEQHPALVVETAGPEPTALDLRAGRAARLFWLWFAANSSVVSLSLGAVLFGLGMSLRQALVAILIGVALSFLPLGLGTLAGKWSGQPTMIVSRATFGLVGNALPAVIAVISRVFWGGALLWILAAGVGRILTDAGLDAGLGEQVWTVVALGVGAALVLVVAVFGYGLLARVQLVLSILTGVLVIGVVALTFPRLDIAAAQTIDDGPWTLLLGGVVLVFSFVGLAWVHSSADVARYQRPDSDGGSTMLWATFGATLPAFILVAWGALLAASDPAIADGLASNPVYTIAALLPAWYPAPLIAALALGLLSGAVITVYSGGFALQSLGVPLRRPGTTLIAGALVVGAGLALLLLAGDARGLIRDVVTTIAVPVAAWAGIVATETMIRRRRFHAGSLLRRGGIYPDVRWGNLVGLVVITGLGFGLTSAVLPGLDWQGYLLPFLGLAADDPLRTSDIGVLVALVLAILLPLATAVPAIRRQERASVD